MEKFEIKKNFIAEQTEEFLILNPFLAQLPKRKFSPILNVKNAFSNLKHYDKITSVHLVLNKFIPQKKNFNLLPKRRLPKAPQSNLQLNKFKTENFPIQNNKIETILKNKKLDKTATGKKILKARSNSHSYKQAIEVKKTVNTAVAQVAIMAGIVFTFQYLPGVVTTINNWITAKNLPPSKIMEEFSEKDTHNNATNDKINTDFDHSQELSQIPKIKIDEETLQAYSIFESLLSQTISIYYGEEQKVTPRFMFRKKEETGTELLNVVCDIGTSQTTCLIYDITNEEIKKDIFKSNSILVSDVINAMSILASDENLYDLCPITNKIILSDSVSCYSTKPELITDIIFDTNGNAIDIDSYKFSVVSFTKKGSIIEKQYEITKDNAEKLEHFDTSNLNSLLEILNSENKSFSLAATFEIERNAPSFVIYNANSAKILKNNSQLKCTSKEPLEL